MIKKLQVPPDTYQLIQETCEDYKKAFRKHRKAVTHFSNNGIYQEWQKNLYRDYEDEER